MFFEKKCFVYIFLVFYFVTDSLKLFPFILTLAESTAYAEGLLALGFSFSNFYMKLLLSGYIRKKSEKPQLQWLILFHLIIGSFNVHLLILFHLIIGCFNVRWVILRTRSQSCDFAKL